MWAVKSRGSSTARDVSESEDRTEVRPDRWAGTRPKAGGGFQPFPADSVEEEEEETELDLFRGSPPSAVEEGQMSRGCGIGMGF